MTMFGWCPRVLTIIPPTIPNESPPTNIVTNDPTHTLDFEYSGVTYNANLFSIIEHTIDTAEGETVTIRESIQVAQSYKVTCSHNMCGLMTCIEEFFERTKVQASKVGGVQRLPFDVVDKWLQINNYLARYSSALRCQNFTKLEEYYNALQEITGCDCGCGSQGSDEIIRLTPLCSTGTGKYNYRE